MIEAYNYLAGQLSDCINDEDPKQNENNTEISISSEIQKANHEILAHDSTAEKEHEIAIEN